MPPDQDPAVVRAIHVGTAPFADLLDFSNLVRMLPASPGVLVDGRDKPGHDGNRTGGYRSEPIS